jgi:hypothetical protein
VRRAQGALALLPPPPPLPPAVAARVGAALAEAADRQAARRHPWWEGLLGRPLVLVAAAAALAVLGAWALAGRLPPAPALLERAEAPAPAATEGTPPPPTPAPRKLVAKVASARRAAVGGQPVTAAQVLQEGARLGTEAGGSLWLRLPDGSRAGLTGATAVTLRRLEDAAVELEVGQGSLALVVPHRPRRALTVRAGEVEVVDLGTRFSVTRSPSRVLVAVEEGEVEVRTGGVSRTLRAGRALTVHEGKVATYPWAPTAAAPPPAEAFVPTEAARLSAEPASEPEPPAPPTGPAEGTGPPPARERPGVPDEDWAPLPGAPTSDPPPPPAPDTVPKGRPARPPSFLQALEERVRAFQRGFNEAILVPAAREGAMHEVVRRARDGQCARALAAADRWLREAPSIHPAEPAWRAEVLDAQRRCSGR